MAGCEGQRAACESCPSFVWVSGIELRSSGLSESIPNCRAISWAGKRINPEREPQDCLKPVFTEIEREEPPRLSVLPRRENLTLLRVPGRVQWDLPCLPLPFLCVPCRYDVDSKSPDLSKHVSSACDCPASPGSLKCRSLTGPWTSLKEHVSRTARREGGGVAVNMVADAGLFCPGMQDFLGQAFCTLGEIVGSSGSRLEKPLT